MAHVTDQLKDDHPWIKMPLVVQAPMKDISLAPLAVEVSRAGGIGFIGAGTDMEALKSYLKSAVSLVEKTHIPTVFGPDDNMYTIPIGIGIINWGVDLDALLEVLKEYKPRAIWFFAPRSIEELSKWAAEVRRTSGFTTIWVQVGSVAEAVQVTKEVSPEVLVVQGNDAGGHGLVRGAGVMSLVPEVYDAIATNRRGGALPAILATGGIVDGRGVAAALALGADGVAMGTRFLASKEAHIAKGYQDEVIRANNGGQNTVRTKVYDTVRGTAGWPETYDGRGLINKSFKDAIQGMSDEENKKLYEEAMKQGDAGWGVNGRMTTYAGAAVGLVKEVKGAAEILQEVREDAKKVIKKLSATKWDAQTELQSLTLEDEPGFR